MTPSLHESTPGPLLQNRKNQLKLHRPLVFSSLGTTPT